MTDKVSASEEDVERAVRKAIARCIMAGIGMRKFGPSIDVEEQAAILARAAIAAMPRQTTDAREILAALLHEAGDISGAIHVREGSCRQINSRVALEAVRVASAHQAPATDAELLAIWARVWWESDEDELEKGIIAFARALTQSSQSYADGMEDAAKIAEKEEYKGHFYEGEWRYRQDGRKEAARNIRQAAAMRAIEQRGKGK